MRIVFRCKYDKTSFSPHLILISACDIIATEQEVPGCSETTRRLMLIKSHIKTIAGILALALLLAGAIGTTALAAGAGSGSPPPTVSQTTNPNDNGSGAAVIPDDENDADKAVLASEAKVTEAEAVSIAEAANPGYTFKVEELDSENGVIFYELKGSGQSGGAVELEINADDGTIMAESEGENEG